MSEASRNRSKSTNIFDDDQDVSSYFKPSKDDNRFDTKSNTNVGISRGQSGSSAPSHDFFRATPADEEEVVTRRELYLQELQGIQNRTLQSTDRSLKVLGETEAVGTAAAQELLLQREQLENADRNLDNMDSTLNQSQKHINHIRSVFGGVKNWWSGKPSAAPAAPLTAVTNTNRKSLSNFIGSSSAPVQANIPVSDFGDSSTRSGSVVPTSGSTPTQTTGPLPVKHFETALDSNLDQMSSGLSRLKLLASGLGDEIEQQNYLLDSMNAKSERVGAKMGAQQKSLDQILGKKK